jgi:lactoylglutathione lyase
MKAAATQIDSRPASYSHDAAGPLAACPTGALCSAHASLPDLRHDVQLGGDMRYLHTMVRITDIEKSLDFYCTKLGMKEIRRRESPEGRFTLIFLASSDDAETAARANAPLLELTYNWDPEAYTGGRNFGHLAYEVDDIYALCERLQKAGVTINRPPRDGRMAFIRSPDNISIELLQKGEAKPPAEPWKSAPNIGVW